MKTDRALAACLIVSALLVGGSSSLAVDDPPFVRITPAEVRWHAIPVGVLLAAVHPARVADLLDDPRSFHWRGQAGGGARDSSLKHHEIPVGRLPNGLERNPAIERHKTAFVMRGEAEQVHVGNLPRTMDSCWVEHS